MRKRICICAHGMPAVQAIMRTIRMCIAPSLVYTARTVPPEITTPYLRLLDRAVFDGVMHDRAWPTSRQPRH